VQQEPAEGVAMSYSFADAAAPTTHTTQWYERLMVGNRGLFHDGWKNARSPHIVRVDFDLKPDFHPEARDPATHAAGKIAHALLRQ
jgi:arylsulfatase